MREKLIELLAEGEESIRLRLREMNGKAILKRDAFGWLADHLLANGVIVLPYKVGDTVWVHDWYLDCDIDGFGVCDEYEKHGDRACGYCRHNYVKKFTAEKKFEMQMLAEIGKTVFLTREEAEAALKEGE